MVGKGVFGWERDLYTCVKGIKTMVFKKDDKTPSPANTPVGMSRGTPGVRTKVST